MTKENKRILITGASGFLGASVFEELAKKKTYQLFTTHKSSRVDITDLAQTRKLVQKTKPDIVIHAAALVNLSRDFEIYTKCCEVNIKGTLNLLEALAEMEEIDKFIYISSEEVYGNTTVPYEEDSRCLPPSGYAVSKLAGENLTKIYARDNRFTGIILRIGTLYGPKQPLQGFIPTITKKALKGETIFLNSGTNKRDYVYIKDAVNAITAAVEMKQAQESEIINVGNGESTSLRNLVQLIVELSASNSSVEFYHYPDRAGEAKRWLMDISKAQRLLSWKPQTPLEVGLKNTVKYYQQSMLH